MKKITLLIALSFLMGINAISQTMTADKVLDKYFKAMGMDKLVKQKSLKATGKQTIQGMELGFALYQSRPLKMRIEVETQGMKIVQAVNGDKGFMINPLTGSSDPQDVSGIQLKAMQKQADMNGNFYKYKEKGMNIELEGEDDVDGKKAYKLKVTDAPDAEGNKGQVTYCFIDKESLMLVKITATTDINGQKMQVDTKFSDYRKIDGVSIAFVTESLVGTMTASKVTIEEAKFNEEMPDSLFSKPE